MRRVLIVGATSAIATATARCFAAEGDALYLVGRNAEKLAALAADLAVRGAGQVATEVLDLARCEEHGGLVERAAAALDGLDVVLVAHGVLPDQRSCERDFAAAEASLRINFLSATSLAGQAANYLEPRRQGVIAVISSVAGDRGRQSNYVYGAAKAGLAAFLQGLRNRLARSNVAVVTVKPGFVDTPMTAALPKNALFASPEAVGRGIHRAILARRDVVYLPGFWRWIMLAVIHVPEFVFKRMRM